jgi:phage shock protein A
MPWFHRRETVTKAFAQQLTEHHAALGALARQVKELEDSLASLEDKHERLRGKFYAQREPQRPESKAEILARFHRGEIKA